MNFVSHAGQSISLLPGFFFMRKRRSQPGHAISTLGIFGFRINWQLQELHCKLAGRSRTPTINTFSHSGQLTFSSAHFFLVPSCSIFTLAEHTLCIELRLVHRVTVRHILDMTVQEGKFLILQIILHSYNHLLFTNKGNFLRDEIPRNI